MSEIRRSGKKYARISVNRRNQLIDLVVQKNKGVAQAAKRLNIKLSTAKHIVKTYMQKGYLYNKKMHKCENTSTPPSKQVSEQKINEQQKQMNQEKKESVKIELKSQGSQQRQNPVLTNYMQTTYPLSKFAGIPIFYFYSKYQY